MTKEESLAAGHAICFADEAGQSREVPGHIFISVVRWCFFVLPLSLSPLWELQPPSHSDRERLETKEEKYRRPPAFETRYTVERGGGGIILKPSIHVRLTQHWNTLLN